MKHHAAGHTPTACAEVNSLLQTCIAADCVACYAVYETLSVHCQYSMKAMHVGTAVPLSAVVHVTCRLYHPVAMQYGLVEVTAKVSGASGVVTAFYVSFDAASCATSGHQAKKQCTLQILLNCIANGQGHLLMQQMPW